MLNVTNNFIMLSVVMLFVMAPPISASGMAALGLEMRF